MDTKIDTSTQKNFAHYAADTPQNKQNKYAGNPLIFNRADPFITKHEGLYYFMASVPEYDRIELRCAESLDGLKTAAPLVIWTKHNKGDMSAHIWAPEMHFIDGAWYIYFAAGTAENVWEIRPYVLKCTGNPMRDKWIEMGRMQAADDDKYSFTDFSLDGTVFEHKGEKYFIWAEKVGSQFGISNLYIAKMESPVKLKTVQVLLTTPDYDWERKGFWVNEGPAVLKRGGRIYVTYSASATGAMYCMGMLSINESDDLLDPRKWQKERYPVLKTDMEKEVFGPGHNSFTVNESGEDICVLHARNYEKIICADPLYDGNRHAYILKINYDKDGKPLFWLP